MRWSCWQVSMLLFEFFSGPNFPTAANEAVEMRFMSDEDTEKLTHTLDEYGRTGSKRDDVTPGSAEADPALPDTPEVMVAFKTNITALEGALAANRISGVEPFQGDILLDKDDRDMIEGTRGKCMNSSKLARKRAVIRQARKLWPQATVPFEVDASRASDLPKIWEAMKEIQQKSCIKFRPRKKEDKNWVRIFKGVGCYAGIGRPYQRPGPNQLSLGPLCLDKGTIIHELMHTLSFFHEQSRPDRDSFLKIYFENIQNGMASQFERFINYQVDTGDTDYDYHSVMHYPNTAFTKNGADTMQAKFSPKLQLGSMQLSSRDVLELNKIYQCKSHSKTWAEWTEWSPCGHDWRKVCGRTRERFCFSANRQDCPGADQFGVQTERKPCNAQCSNPIDGHWGAWESWSHCSRTCDEGTHKRQRWCNNPKPSKGGAQCKGKSEMTKECRMARCKGNHYDTNFESGLGMWNQDKTDNFDWSRISNGSPTLRTGPKADHTTGEGFYLYIEGSPPRAPGDVARLISKEFPANFGPKCMSFYYTMNGKHIGYLDLHLKTKSRKFINLWRKNGHQSQDWLNAAVTIHSYKEPFLLVFEAERGIGELSDIAIDDITFADGKCGLSVQGCQDHNPLCGDWQAMGACNRNAGWMNKYCCRTCSEIPGQCRDKSKHCRRWAVAGECVRNKKWMWANCCKACKGCNDSSPSCPVWAAAGECWRSPVWMGENCETSCGMCKPR